MIDNVIQGHDGDTVVTYELQQTFWDWMWNRDRRHVWQVTKQLRADRYVEVRRYWLGSFATFNLAWQFMKLQRGEFKVQP